MNLNAQPPQNGQPYYPIPQPPQTGLPYYPNPQLPQRGKHYNSIPQFPPTSQPLTQGTPNVQTVPINNDPINTVTSGPITITGPHIVNKVEMPQLADKTKRKPNFVPLFERESPTLFYPVCEIEVPTKIKIKTNMKALLIAIESCNC